MSKEEERDDAVRAGMSQAEMRDNVVRLAFGGEPRRLEEFCSVLERAIPAGTAVVLRGSSVTGERASDGAPFDADGPGTSDLDLTLVGSEVLDHFTEDAFYIPGAHTKPLSDEHPDISPSLFPVRERLSTMVGRPVNIQGTRDWVMFVREHVMGQPCLTLLGKVDSQ